MLSFIAVKFNSIVHVQKIKGSLGLQIYPKQQMLSVELFGRLLGHFSFHNQNNPTSSPGFLG